MKEKNIYIPEIFRKNIITSQKNNLQMFSEVVVKILNLVSFSKHQTDSGKCLDLKASYPNVSIWKYCINESVTFAVMSAWAKPNAIQ